MSSRVSCVLSRRRRRLESMRAHLPTDCECQCARAPQGSPGASLITPLINAHKKHSAGVCEHIVCSVACLISAITHILIMMAAPSSPHCFFCRRIFGSLCDTTTSARTHPFNSIRVCYPCSDCTCCIVMLSLQVRTLKGLERACVCRHPLVGRLNNRKNRTHASV